MNTEHSKFMQWKKCQFRRPPTQGQTLQIYVMKTVSI